MLETILTRINSMNKKEIITSNIEYPVPKKSVSAEGYFTYDVSAKASLVFLLVKFCQENNNALIEKKIHHKISDILLSAVKNQYEHFIHLEGGGILNISKGIIFIEWLPLDQADTLYEAVFERDDCEMFCQHINVSGKLKSREHA